MLCGVSLPAQPFYFKTTDPLSLFKPIISEGVVIHQIFKIKAGRGFYLVKFCAITFSNHFPFTSLFILTLLALHFYSKFIVLQLVKCIFLNLMQLVLC